MPDPTVQAVLEALIALAGGQPRQQQRDDTDNRIDSREQTVEHDRHGPRQQPYDDASCSQADGYNDGAFEQQSFDVAAQSSHSTHALSGRGGAVTLLAHASSPKTMLAIGVSERD